MTKPPFTHHHRPAAVYLRRFEVTVMDGPDCGASARSTEDELTIGTATGTDLRLTDPAVSRHHCVLRISERGLEVRDLGSTNGTRIGSIEVVRCYLRDNVQLMLGATTVAVTLLREEVEVPLSDASRYGELRGESAPMRRLFLQLARFAGSDATVLVHGETGTGKELVAEALHQQGPRASGPFVVVDCTALPRELAETELFGHVRGAFTGADDSRTGAFEQAHGGTLFLDEIGDLPLELQPLLLRALESRTIRPIGAAGTRSVDVRVIAASARDLRIEVNAKRFRSDLYYRLNVLRVVVPPLRERGDDIALLAAQFWRATHRGGEIPPDLVRELAVQVWPGNVRELRNAVERAALIGWTPARDETHELSHGQAKERAIERWEAGWVAQLLAANAGNLTRAARAARMSRSHLRRLLVHYGLVPRTPGDDDDA